MTAHVSVCVCTFKRPALLKRLLDSLERLRTDDRFTFSVVIADNDPAGSARRVCEEAASTSKLDVRYAHEPRQNIALARNEALRHARGDFAAFIDDDEFPDPDWLANMIAACERFQCAGVLGPVRPHFDGTPPEWVVKGRFCERAEHATGQRLAWGDCRTGNVLFRRSIVADAAAPFREEFGKGGEDGDFFVRMTAIGHVFRWCNEAVVYETVPPDRWSRTYMLKRALLRGSLTMKLPGSHAGYLARALLAIPTYAVVIPFASTLGQHVAMKYCIRLCDHAGLLMAALGFQPVRER